jgi:hypothetical protein
LATQPAPPASPAVTTTRPPGGGARQVPFRCAGPATDGGRIMARCRHGDGGPREQLSRSWSRVLTDDSRRGCTREHSPAVPAGQGAAGWTPRCCPRRRRKVSYASATPPGAGPDPRGVWVTPSRTRPGRKGKPRISINPDAGQGLPAGPDRGGTQ